LVARFSETPTLLRQILYGFCFITIFFVLPYKKMFLNVYWIGEKDVEEKFGLFVKHLAEKRPDWREYALAHDTYEAQFLFYMRMYNQKGYKLSGEKGIVKDSLYLNDLKLEQKVAVFQQNVENVLQSKYETELLYAYDEYKLYRILSRKPQNAVPTE
jgi:hypothetical protein